MDGSLDIKVDLRAREGELLKKLQGLVISLLLLVPAPSILLVYHTPSNFKMNSFPSPSLSLFPLLSMNNQ